jgi:hypothetical protein
MVAAVTAAAVALIVKKGGLSGAPSMTAATRSGAYWRTNEACPTYSALTSDPFAASRLETVFNTATLAAIIARVAYSLIAYIIKEQSGNDRIREKTRLLF